MPLLINGHTLDMNLIKKCKNVITYRFGIHVKNKRLIDLYMVEWSMLNTEFKLMPVVKYLIKQYIALEVKNRIYNFNTHSILMASNYTETVTTKVKLKVVHQSVARSVQKYIDSNDIQVIIYSNI